MGVFIKIWSGIICFTATETPAKKNIIHVGFSYTLKLACSIRRIHPMPLHICYISVSYISVSEEGKDKTPGIFMCKLHKEYSRIINYADAH